MAYDRYDRDEHSRWSNERSDDRSGRGSRGDDRARDPRSHDHERGFFERAGEEISSWFGGGERDHRDHPDHQHDGHRDPRMSGGREHNRERDYDRGCGRDYDRDRASYERHQSSRDQNEDRGLFNRGGSSDRDYNPDYRPMTGDYGRTHHESEQFFAASGIGRGERGMGGYDRSQSPYGRDEYRGTSFAGSRKDERDFDPHYRNWRERHMSELDRDYDDFRSEHQSKFESDFGGWREKRQQKRGLLGQVREHMEVVGKDDQHVGKVDKVAGDRLILAKSDPESDGAHHSLSCSEIDRIEGDRVILDCTAADARKHWRDENRSRALFERHDQGEMGPRNLNRSFEGTYR